MPIVRPHHSQVVVTIVIEETLFQDYVVRFRSPLRQGLHSSQSWRVGDVEAAVARASNAALREGMFLSWYCTVAAAGAELWLQGDERTQAVLDRVAKNAVESYEANEFEVQICEAPHVKDYRIALKKSYSSERELGCFSALAPRPEHTVSDNSTQSPQLGDDPGATSLPLLFRSDRDLKQLAIVLYAHGLTTLDELLAASWDELLQISSCGRPQMRHRKLAIWLASHSLSIPFRPACASSERQQSIRSTSDCELKVVDGTPHIKASLRRPRSAALSHGKASAQIIPLQRRGGVTRTSKPQRCPSGK